MSPAPTGNRRARGSIIALPPRTLVRIVRLVRDAQSCPFAFETGYHTDEQDRGRIEALYRARKQHGPASPGRVVGRGLLGHVHARLAASVEGAPLHREQSGQGLSGPGPERMGLEQLALSRPTRRALSVATRELSQTAGCPTPQHVASTLRRATFQRARACATRC